MNCRFCDAPLRHVFLDLGFSPPSNAYRSNVDLSRPELYYPLKLYVCGTCWLVQTEDHTRPDELFSSDYAYYSSVSQSSLNHAEAYCSMATDRFRLDESSFVIEIGSNDGYLLQNFVRRRIPCLGVEPASDTAAAAESIGIPVLNEFFSSVVAARIRAEGRTADLVVGNNVYAHVPDINDFTQGLKIILKRGGTFTLEFPHLLRLIENTEFDTAYHEHFSYLSLHTAKMILERHGLNVYDVEHLSTHGGSLRLYGTHEVDAGRPGPTVADALREEQAAGLRDLGTYERFQRRADRIKYELLVFLIERKRQGETVAAYGAAAKGNTLLNYAGIKSDLVAFVCDAAPSKQGRYLPGSHIPIVPPRILEERRPETVLILPWNLSDEITRQHAYVYRWGGQFVTAIPSLQVHRC